MQPKTKNNLISLGVSILGTIIIVYGVNAFNPVSHDALVVIGIVCMFGIGNYLKE